MLKFSVGYKTGAFLTALVVSLIAVFMFLGFSVMGYFLPLKYKEEIIACCEECGIDKHFVASIICVESGYNKNAVSKKGAKGLMQIMPSTAKSFYDGDNFSEEILFNADDNIKIGVAYLKYLFNKYKDEVTVLACYNAGERVVLEWINKGEKLQKTQIEYKETLNYVKKVQKLKNYYKLYYK